MQTKKRYGLLFALIILLLGLTAAVFILLPEGDGVPAEERGPSADVSVFFNTSGPAVIDPSERPQLFNERAAGLEAARQARVETIAPAPSATLKDSFDRISDAVISQPPDQLLYSGENSIDDLERIQIFSDAAVRAKSVEEMAELSTAVFYGEAVPPQNLAPRKSAASVEIDDTKQE